MMLLSPRNSIDGHLAVTDKCDCKLWILPSQRLGNVDQVLEKRPMTVRPLPELLELLDEGDVPIYAYMKTFDEARQDPFVVLHTSGSTGLPKPIVVPNGSLATVDAHHLLPPVEGRLTQAQYFEEPHRAYSTFPNFHSAGMVWCFAMPFWFELSIVLGPAMAPVNLDLINAMFDHGNVDGSLLAPSTLEAISKEPASLERMSKTLFTCFGGGPLSQECGNRISTVCSVFNTVGVTEGSLFPITQAEREDWNYIHFHPAGGYTFQQRSEELWEQFQTRDRKLDLTQAFFQTFPELDEFAIKDLYKKHPTKPDRWLYKGRADDVIVLSNGEKLNPLDMEAIINEHPQVKASLVVGQGQFQTTALVQLKNGAPTDNSELQALKDSIWVNIEAANAQAPAHAQLHRDYIMFAPNDKPFILAGKETVLRAMTVRLYDEDIQKFYAKRKASSFANATCIDMSSLETISTGLREFVGGILEIPSIGVIDDLFAAGLDSLSVLKILASIRKSISSFAPAGQSPVGSAIIYSNPTIEKLAAALYRLTSADAWALNSSQSESTHEIEEMVKKHTSTLPSSPRASHATDLVILTGSTGSLGSYLLDDLLRRDNDVKIVCLNRSINGGQRQMKVNSERGIPADFPANRVQFLHTDLSRPRFGLDESTYSMLLEGCTHIIHNQWQVDFNLALSSFEPQVQGVRNLVDFCIESRKDANIFFVSSVGVVSDQKTNDSVAESLISDFSVTKGGYGSSKLVSELVLAEAFSRSGVKGKICRIGQIAGPVGTKTGMWNKHEWLPSVSTSRTGLLLCC
jgi:acyl-CoA synthetase (AMP-forming)/AMP-acid ligase II